MPQDKVLDVIELAKQRGAGLLHITNAGLPNPYNQMPSDAYLKILFDAVGKGKPQINKIVQTVQDGADTPLPPSSLTISSFDYTSVQLEWTSSSPHAIAVYQNGLEIIRIPGAMTRVTVGSLDTNSAYEFKIRAIGRSGDQSGFSNVVKQKTNPLPDGKPIINIAVTEHHSKTIYEADILIPFAFNRIFITETHTECNYAAYPMSTDHSTICAKWMIEGSTFYKYSGAQTPTGWTWQWTPMSLLDSLGQNMKVERNKYHYKWYVPITSSTTTFVVQGEGLNPRTDVFFPTPCNWEARTDRPVAIVLPGTYRLIYGQGKHDFCPYNCKGEALCSTSSVKWCDKYVLPHTPCPISIPSSSACNH